MQRALIIGSTGGIGRAFSKELAARDFEITGLSRTENGLDVTSESSIQMNFEQLSAPFDLIFIATGALEIDGDGPEKSLRQLSARALHNQFCVNALGPALILKHAVKLLPKDSRSVVAALSARVGSITDNGLGGWYSYRAAKAALNQLIHTAAVEISRTHKHAIITALHPGTVATPFTKKFINPQKATPPEIAARNLLETINNLTVRSTGKFFDYTGKPIPW